MMRSRIRRCLSLIMAVWLFCLPAAAAQKKQETSEKQQTTVILQLGNPVGLRNGEKLQLPAPRYADNGAIQVPLRAVCEALGYRLTWDTQRREADVGQGKLVMAQGAWHCTANGRKVVLTTPVENVNGTLYVPLQVLGELDRVSVHSFGFYEGGYLVIGSTPLSQAQVSEAAATALEVLGPNTGLFDSTAVLLRCDSRQALVGGERRELCEETEKITPRLTEDGTLLLPIVQTARLCGWECTENVDRVVFSRDDKRLIVDREEQTPEGVQQVFTVIDDVLYSTAAQYRELLGAHTVFNAAGGFILLTDYDVTQFPALQTRAWEKARSLSLLRYDNAKGLIALTFDDGPSGKLTTRLLDGLRQRGAHATFFLCDYRIALYPGLMERYLAEGHEVGNHSANHETLTKCDARTLTSELDLTNQSIRRLAGVSPVLMRPPGGAYNKTVLDAISKRGMSCIMWSLDTVDWKYRDADVIVKKVLETVRDGDIILLHDLYATSVDAALRIVDALQAQGYEFVTVSELASAKGVTLRPGSVYSGMR